MSLPMEVHLEGGGEQMKRALDALLKVRDLPEARPLAESKLPENYKIKFDEYLTLIDQALILFRDFYVNRPLKEATHAAQPVRRLEILRLEIAHAKAIDPIAFHRRMTEIFMSVHDRHMRYFLPTPFHDRWAMLGFEVEQYFPRDKDGHVMITKPRYLVSRLIKEFSHPTFRRGVDVVSWNGIPIERAIELNGDHHAGSNAAARLARGLTRLTVRPCWVSSLPDEDWVIVGYREKGGSPVRFLKLDWWVVNLRPEDAGSSAREPGPGVEDVRLGPPGPAVGPETVVLGPPGRLQSGMALAKSIDEEAEAVRQLRRALLINTAPGVAEDALGSRMPDVIRGVVRTATAGQYRFCYLRIYTFNVEVEAFLEELVRRVRYAKERYGAKGLILDVRDNGGGWIPAGERLLQLFTPRQIEPQRFEFLSTPAALDFCGRVAFLESWASSLRKSAEIGASYSRGFPITPPEACNCEEPVFDLPVVLIVNAQSYSTTDMLAAGFKDHGVGQILATDANIGAGGANTASHADLLELSGGEGPLEPLPQGAGMKVAIRRALRVGPEAGTPLEELGIQPDARHYMSREDLLDGNLSLIDHAVRMLQEMRFEVQGSGRSVKVLERPKGVSRIAWDFHGRRDRSMEIRRNRALQVAVEPPKAVHFKGYDGDRLIASRWVDLESRLDLRADSFLDLYCFVRALAAAENEVPIEAGFKGVVAALRRAEGEISNHELHTRTMSHLLFEQHLYGPEPLRRLGYQLRQVEGLFLRRVWPDRRGRILDRIRRLRGRYLTSMQQGVQKELKSRGVEDPVITVPLYLVTQAPPPGRLIHSFSSPDHTIGVVGIEQNPGELLSEAFRETAVDILEQRARTAARRKPSPRRRAAARNDRRKPPAAGPRRRR